MSQYRMTVMATNAIRSALTAGLVAAAVAGCGGGGGGGNANASLPPAGNGSSWTAGQFLPADSFAAQCESPRTDTNPDTGQALFSDIQGSTLDENNWLRSWSNDLYLWYDEIVDQDPGGFASPLAYFNELKTTANTVSGNPKDQFHFTWDTAQYEALSQSGISAGYGADFALLNATPPRDIVVALTQPNSPASVAALARGTRILSIDGVDAVNGNTQADVATLNAGLFPAGINETHTFVVEDLNSAATRMITMTSAEITSTPVQNIGTITSPQGANVGYLLFNDHIATAESGLYDAMNQLAAANIEDLIIDVRYNGGGFLAIASQLAYMVAGGALTSGRVFENLEFNGKHPTTNPITGATLGPLPFLDVTIGLSVLAPDTALPTLDLPRVFVITGSGTCSASESIINSLRGIGVQVIQIGDRTCGKPYGFYPADNCGTTYFSIQFRGVNDAGFGDYADGFTPSNGTTNNNDVLPGCVVDDDFNHALGDPTEARLAAALQFRDTETCPAVSSPATLTQSLSLPDSDTGIAISKPPWRSNRMLGQ